MSQPTLSKIFITSADHYVGKQLVTLLASMQHQSAFSSITCGGQDRAKMRELERLGGVEVVQYKPDDKKDLQKHFKGQDIVCILPPVVEQRTGLTGAVVGGAVGGPVAGLGGGGTPSPKDLERWSTWLKECGRSMIDACQLANVKCVLLMTPLCIDQLVLGTEVSGHHGKYQLLHGFHEIEQHFDRSSIPQKCTIKNSLFMQTFLLYSHPVQSDGVLPSPTDQGRFSPISLRDVSRFIAVVASGKKIGGQGGEPDRPQHEWRENMPIFNWKRDEKSNPISPQHLGKTYKLTGQETVTGEQAVQKLGKVIGAPLKYKTITIDEARKIVQDSDMKPERMEVELLMEVYEQVRNNKYDMKSDDFKKVTGRDPLSLVDYFEDHANDFKPRH